MFYLRISENHGNVVWRTFHLKKVNERNFMTRFIAAITKKQTKFYCQQSQPTLIPIRLRQVFFILDTVNPGMLLLHANIDQNKYGCGRLPV